MSARPRTTRPICRSVPGSHATHDTHIDDAPQVTDVTSDLIRCYENNTASSTSVATVQAGATVGFQANGDFYHPGVRRPRC